MNSIVFFNIIYIIINIGLILYSIRIVWGFSTLNLTKETEFTQFLIEDIIINETCPNHYKKHTLATYKGFIHNGCYCSSNDTLYEQQCDYDQKFKLNCSEVNQIKSIDIVNYEGKQFCIKKGKQYSYYLENNYLSKNNCSNNYYNCGIIDSFNQSLCLPNANECPINKIVINQNEILSEKYKTYKLNNSKYIHISNNETNSKIIHNIVLTDRDYKCEYPNETILKYYYKLENNKLTCDRKDNFYNDKIDTINKENIYKENIIYEQIKKLPKYPIEEIKKDNFSLLSGQLKGYDLIAYSNIITLIKYNTLPSYFILSFIILWIFICFMIFGYIYLFCGRCMKNGNYDDDYYVVCPNQDNDEKNQSICMLCLCIFILGAFIIHCIVFRRGANKLKNSTILFLVIDLIIFLLSLAGYIILNIPLNNIKYHENIWHSYQNNIIVQKNMTYIYLILTLFGILFLFIQRFRKAFDSNPQLNMTNVDLISPPPQQINDNFSPNPNINMNNNFNPKYNQNNLIQI